MGTQLWVESEGRECPEIRGLGVSGWSRIKCSSPGCLFAAIVLYGSSKSLKIEDGKHHPPDKGAGEQGQILGKATETHERVYKARVYKSGLMMEERGAARPHPAPLQLKGTLVCAGDSRPPGTFVRAWLS